jgi:hypothetical protein
MHSAHSAYRGPATAPNRPKRRGPQPARTARGSARSVPAHRQVNGGSALHGESSHYRASPDPMWSDMVCVDCPRRHPHGSQRACYGSSGATTTHRAHIVVWLEAAGNWTVGRKVSIGAIHGTRRTCLTRLRVLARSEEGRRRRCGAHRRG